MLDVRMSCSYGPGRYDPNYAERGIDYPPAYVRWTENRNMQAFQELLYRDKIDVSHLTTHEFPIEEAPDAYDLILEKREPYLGVLIHYDAEKEIAIATSFRRGVRVRGEPRRGWPAANSVTQRRQPHRLLANLTRWILRPQEEAT